MIRKFFNKSANPPIPQNHLRLKDVLFVLGCAAQIGATETSELGDPKGENYAAYTFSNLVNGKTFSLEAFIRHQGRDYKTEVRAEIVSPGVLEIKSIIFDNKPEKLDNAKEIYSVLNYIGNCHVRSVFFRGMPKPHDEKKGPFTRLGRFMTRHLPKPSGGDFL